MRCFLPIAAFFLPLAGHAQQILSFEPGGREACAKAIHQSIPGANENPRTFGNACAERDLQIEKSQFAALSKSIEGRGPAERLAFNALLVSFTAFRDARLKAEGCHSGTGCGVDLKAQEAGDNYQFLQLVDGRLAVPPSTADDLTASDAALNAIYDKVLASLPAACTPADPWGADCISQGSFRDLQRDWIRYRDAWGAFGVLHAPQTTAGSWVTFLTRERTRQVRDRFKARFPSDI